MTTLEDSKLRRVRSAGILLHPTSLPGPYGIGDIGAAACTWVNELVRAKQTWWQILPLGPTGYGDSPYQSFSAFAGNPYLISPDGLAEDGLLKNVVRKRYHTDLIRHLVRAEIERGLGVVPYDVVVAATKAVDDVFSKLPPVPFAFRAPIPPALAAGMGIPVPGD